MPWQHLRSTLADVAMRALVTAESKTRSAMQGLTQVDHKVFSRAVAPLDFHHTNIVTSSATLSLVDQGYLHRINNEQSSLCIFCQQEESS
eukprot:9560447-Karenia_brevis.AAC.1